MKSRLLKEMAVVLIDCQTSGATPSNGEVIEIGWAVTTAAGPGYPEIESRLIRPLDQQGVPNRILALTGLTHEDLEGGDDGRVVWRALRKTCRTAARMNRMKSCPAVIHYAKFEVPFLRDLAEKYDRGRWPFEVVCTHEIARRLLNDLPRKGIRAVAGYLGHSVAETKRAADHVAATACIWDELVDRLADEGIKTLDQFRKWLCESPVKASSGRRYPMDPSKRSGLPDRPGVYRMLRSNGDVLYVGKAKSLKQRVSSYFRTGAKHSEHILEMLAQARSLRITETESALEAAILEHDEIKRLSPPYNKSLRKRQRNLYFWNDDFDEAVLIPDIDHRLGPVSTVQSGALNAIYRLLTESLPIGDDSLRIAALGLPPEFAPDETCFMEGLSAFQNLVGDRIGRKRMLQEMIDLGREFWRERLAEKEAVEEESVDEVEENEKTEFVWTPEAVAHTLNRNVLWSTYELRRGRWLLLLSNASVAWAENDNWRFLAIQNGEVESFGNLENADNLPVPDLSGRTRLDKQQAFSVETWDRLRVLSTEIRSLLTKDTSVVVRFGPAFLLNSPMLKRLYTWV